MNEDKSKDDELIRRGDAVSTIMYYNCDIGLSDRLYQVPAVTLPEPVVKPEDVVEGIEWDDETRKHRIERCMGSSAQIYYLGGISIWFSKKAVAAMLNVAKEVTFPEGHPLAPKPEPEPTLIDLVERYISIVPSGLSRIALREKIQAAIEAEKRKVKE